MRRIDMIAGLVGLISDEVRDEVQQGHMIGLLRSIEESFALDMQAMEELTDKAEANRLLDRKRLIVSWMSNGECAWMIAQAWEALGDEKMGVIFEGCPRLTSEKDLVNS